MWPYTDIYYIYLHNMTLHTYNVCNSQPHPAPQTWQNTYCIQVWPYLIIPDTTHKRTHVKRHTDMIVTVMLHWAGKHFFAFLPQPNWLLGECDCECECCVCQLNLNWIKIALMHEHVTCNMCTGVWLLEIDLSLSLSLSLFYIHYSLS